MTGRGLGCVLVLALILSSSFVSSRAAAASPFGWTVAGPIEADNVEDAMAPAIGGNAAGTAFAVWHQFDGTRFNIWANRYSVGAGWETATPVESSPEPASRPHVAVDALGNALAVWEQFDGMRTNIWANRYAAGTGWSSSTMIETDNAGNAYAAHVAVDAGGDGIAVWEQHDGARWRAVANRYAAGVGWGTAVVLDSGVGGGVLGTDVAADPAGNAIATWVQCCGPANVWARRFTQGTGWEPAALIETGDAGDALEVHVAIDGSGNATAVWRYWDGSDRSAWSNRYVVGSGWGTATPIETAPGDVGTVRIGVNFRGNATAVWGQWDGARTNIWATRYAAGTWGLPALLESDAGEARDPQVAVDARNNAIAVWWQLSGVTLNIFANRFTAATGWGTPTLVERDNAGPATGPQVAADSAGNAVAVWQHSDGTRYSIWANHYARDNLPPDLVVTSPTMGLTNDPSVTVAGSTEPDANVTVDGTPVALDANGAFELPVTLFDGPHTFTVVARDVEGNSATALRTITVDTTAPTVTIDSPSTGLVTNLSALGVSGSTEPGARVVVDGFVVSVGPGGGFALGLALAPGTNVITATVTDPAGNVATASVTVTYVNPVPGLEQELNATRDELAATRDDLTTTRQDLQETQDALAAANANLAGLGTQILGLLSLFLVFVVVTVVQSVLYMRLRRKVGGSGQESARE